MTKAKKPYQMAVMHPLPRVNEIRCHIFTYMTFHALILCDIFITVLSLDTEEVIIMAISKGF